MMDLLALTMDQADDVQKGAHEALVAAGKHWAAAASAKSTAVAAAFGTAPPPPPLALPPPPPPLLTVTTSSAVAATHTLGCMAVYPASPLYSMECSPTRNFCSAAGALPTALIIGMMLMAVAVIALVVFVERAQRRLLIQYPKRQRGNKMMGGETSHLPLKLNTAGVIPPIFASSLLLMPITVITLSAGQGPEWMTAAAAYLGRGSPIYMAIYIGLILFFAFFYTAVVFNVNDTADNLKKYGGFIPGIRPGKNTAEYLDRVLTRLTVVGAAYLAIICAIPELLISNFGVPFYFGGTSLLIVVTVTMDTVTQVQSHLIAHQYEGLIKKQRLRGRR